VIFSSTRLMQTEKSCHVILTAGDTIAFFKSTRR